MKKINIDVIRNDKKARIECSPDETILNALLRQGYYMSVVCGGRGTCGKCKIKVLQGDIKVRPQDEKVFTSEELASGYRLACKAYAEEDCLIELLTSDESDFEILSNLNIKEDNLTDQEDHGYGFAVDIGTTTIAVSLLGLSSKKVLYTHTAINRQRAYGADVISRMDASNNGKDKLLKESIQLDLLNIFRYLTKHMKIDKNQVEKIVISGNTTMGHLLMGYSCEGLGVHPYEPVNINTIQVEFRDLFETDEFAALVTLIPGISTFVGADIVSGLALCDFDKKDSPSMLIDIGTNGEMAIGSKEGTLVGSTAAGPAFEGGNITHGIGSVAGAISGIRINPKNSSSGEDVEIKTIGDKDPVGICGTGVIEITSELIKNNIVDETGLLEDRYFDDGYPVYTFDGPNSKNQENAIRFTQKDIREIQLAKAAIRSGIDILIMRYGVSYDQIDNIYLAGGFGYKIDIEKAAKIGLLPKEIIGKVKAIGNSSLNGAIEYLIDDNSRERYEDIVSKSKELNLSSDEEFYNMYIENMQFDE